MNATDRRGCAITPLPTTARPYRATDPDRRLFDCACGRDRCRAARQLDVQAHCGALVKAVLSCGHADLLGHAGHSDPWPGVTYSLQMAGSLEDVFADPSFLDDSDAAFMCRPAWESDERDRESASKHMAALIVFNFIWNAFEAAVEEIVGPDASSEKPAVRARKHLCDRPGCSVDVPDFRRLYALARRFCVGSRELREQITANEARWPLPDAARAVELARLFRNHVMHGRERTGLSEGREGCFRLYSVSKLVLLLIQVLLLDAISEPQAVVQVSVNREGTPERADWLISRLHLTEETWRGQDPEQLLGHFRGDRERAAFSYHQGECE